jgi:outer membrane biosynthesis protein TonB
MVARVFSLEKNLKSFSPFARTFTVYAFLKTLKKKPLFWALAASLLIHLFAFLFTSWATMLGWIFLTAKKVAAVPAAIELTFDDDKPREVVEAPESARRDETNPEAKYLSDKNAVAQNPAAPENLPPGEAYAQGLSDADALASQRHRPEPQHEPPGAGDQQSQEDMSTNSQPQPFHFGASSFRRELLMSKNAQAETPATAGRDNQASRSPALGDFSLSTYEWEFAPYMLWLKRRIRENIYPPPAFTHLGLISGKTQLRFRIYPDGSLQTLEVNHFNGHEALMKTSVRAVQLSAPFRKLPENFPEPYLEITAQFEYTIIRP